METVDIEARNLKFKLVADRMYRYIRDSELKSATIRFPVVGNLKSRRLKRRGTDTYVGSSDLNFYTKTKRPGSFQNLKWEISELCIEFGLRTDSSRDFLLDIFEEVGLRSRLKGQLRLGGQSIIHQRAVILELKYSEYERGT